MAATGDQPPASRGDGRADTATSTGTTTRAREVGEEARGQAAEVTETAKQQAARVGGEVREQTVHLVEDLRHELHDQARAQTDRFGESTHRLSDEMHALADGRPEDAGRLPERTDRLADQIGQIAHEIDTRGFDGLLEEVQDYARRRPGAFLLGAAVAGFAMSRMTRSERDRELSRGETRGDQPVHDRGNGQASADGGTPGAAGDPAASGMLPPPEPTSRELPPPPGPGPARVTRTPDPNVRTEPSERDPVVEEPRPAGRPPRADEPPHPPLPPTPGSGPGPEVRP